MEGYKGEGQEEPSRQAAYKGPSPTALLIQAKFAKPKLKPTEATPWKPTPFFFYGTLMDAEILQTVLGLTEPPKLQRGVISNFKVKMWGPYPALVRAESGTVEGMVYEIQTEEQVGKLQRYETSAYTPANCAVDLVDGGRVDFARTFIWSGHSDGRELEDGSFDMLRYQKHFKPSMVGKPAPEV